MNSHNHAIFLIREEIRHLNIILKGRKHLDYDSSKEIINLKLKDLIEALKKLEL